ncbi:MAG TPA: hypothetical protein VD815_05745 [Candidatus Saccharimonadales bacterium]|nr:hypothetical protein [Candidatus Saccharimonadales bacterium]
MSLPDSIAAVGSSTGPRFHLVGLFPSIVLFILISLLIILWTEIPPAFPNVDSLLEGINKMDLKKLTIVFVFILVFSFLLFPFQKTIVHLYEGYWPTNKVVARLNNYSTCCQRKKYEKAKNDGNDSFIVTYFPDRNLLPTSLGNILRASEYSINARYNFATAEVWPRLYPLISENLKAIIDDQRNRLDVSIKFSFIFIIATIISFVFCIGIINEALERDNGLNSVYSTDLLLNSMIKIKIALLVLIKYLGWFVIPMLTYTLSWLFYRGALSIAISYGKGIQVAFDLHRFDLLKKLHLDPPADLDDEKALNGKISDFFTLHRHYNFVYTHS